MLILTSYLCFSFSHEDKLITEVLVFVCILNVDFSAVSSAFFQCKFSIFSSLLFYKASWCLKTRALTEQVYVDEVDVDEEGIAEMLMDDNAVAQLPRQYIYAYLFYFDNK